MHQRAGIAGADEGEHAADELIPCKLALDPFEPIAEDPRSEEQDVIGAAQSVNIGPRKTTPAHPDHIEPIEHRALADGEAKRNEVSRYPADPGDHRTLADPHKLVDGGTPTENNPVPQCDVTTENRIVGQDNVVADVTVVADMRADHEEAAVAHACDAATVLGPQIHGDMLADIAVGADLESRRSAAILDRLRRRAERSERIDLAAWADCGVTGHMHMGDEGAVLANGDVRADHAIGADGDLRPDRRTIGDAGGWIDCDRPGRRNHWGSPSHDHGADFRFGHDLIGDACFAAIPPHVLFPRLLGHVILDRVAGHDELAKLRLVDGEEED